MARLNESRIRAKAVGSVLADNHLASACAPLGWSTHAAHGAALYVSLDDQVTVTQCGGPAVQGRTVIVPPDQCHSVICPGPTISVLYDPESARDVARYSRLHSGAFPPTDSSARRVQDIAFASRASLRKADVLDGFAREVRPILAARVVGAPIDGRVMQVLEALRSPDADGRLTLPRTGISPVHIRALFARDIGMPIRTYHLWRRLLSAMAGFAKLDATTAAHKAGFADLAHFSRTCRRMFGDSPSGLVRGLIRR